MSLAGIHSNRGDGYQTSVALDWALTVLFDPDFQWIEVDSVLVPVDDIVVGKSDGTLICCQCKKNQIDFKSWSIANLSGELIKASKLLSDNKSAIVLFYSRSPFGYLAKLHEHSFTQPNEETFYASLTNEHRKIDVKLSEQLAIQAPGLSTYEFFRRTHFEISPSLDRMKVLQLERLRDRVCNPKIAYNTLWTRLDKLGGRMESHDISAPDNHRLTKDDLLTILNQAGIILSPPMDIAETLRSFAEISAIGRVWRRDIAGKRIPNSVLPDLITAIDDGKRSVLVTGLPGSGKTCVMLDLQEALEQRVENCSNLVPLFIQSREFTDLSTMQDRQAHGLSEKWVEKAASMAEMAKVVIVIDSLDVLSIAREHRVLNYFLAQIDRLLLVPNIMIVTACRDFDRHFDRRIAARKWDCELTCQPLNWETDILPLLRILDIQTGNIDGVTCELIRNPRELALFVELAQREGCSFNAINGQALAQRYLDAYIRKDELLGETAIQAIEAIADDMLRTRRLAVPQQRFSGSQDIKRALLSINVLQETQSGELTFGHQTLLDVLVISSAVRRGITLHAFIQELSPVPFVRPSIRSFVLYLAAGDRRVFRKQIRAVLTSNAAFHIRRLVAESLAEQIPRDEDWPMIRDLRNNHRDMFLTIYNQARRIEWHYFWLKHLLPVLKATRDVEELTTHLYHVSRWKNEDAAGVFGFWMDALKLGWMDASTMGFRLSHELATIDTKYMGFVATLLERLLSMPTEDDSFLGNAIARCVDAGKMEDKWLWQYIAGDVKDEDVVKFRFDNKLHCDPNEFRNVRENFLLQRMKESTGLLDLSINSLEKWSLIYSSQFGSIPSGHNSHFLDKTSYDYSHSQHDLREVTSENILLDAVEAAVLHQANTHSGWWQANRERLCFSHELALCYFAIRACTTNPIHNVSVAGRLLTDKDMLESKLSFELGELLKAVFRYLDTCTQDAVIGCIMNMHEDERSDRNSRFWIMQEKAELFAAIPPYLRSPEAQIVLDNYEKIMGTMIRRPSIWSRGGIVDPPFSCDVFHRVSDDGVLRLLMHYSGHKRQPSDFLTGGEREVGIELNKASSQHPTRFMGLLSVHWTHIPDRFRDDIMDGVARYLGHRYGCLQADAQWQPIEEPDAPTLVGKVLDELERHPSHWWLNRAASSALQYCAYVIEGTPSAERLLFLAIHFADFREKSATKKPSVNLITTGINMKSGHVAEAVMILAEKFIELNLPFPELLAPSLLRLAGNSHPAIRALILRRLPYVQYHKPELGWELFHFAMRDATTGLWKEAEHCLYYAYANHFEQIEPLLLRIQREGNDKDMETWGRISGLAVFSGHIKISNLINKLQVMDSSGAWKGAVSIWTHYENIIKHPSDCLAGIEAGLNFHAPHALAVAKKMGQIFSKNNPILSIPIELIRLCFTVLESDNEKKANRIFGFDQWLNSISHRDPEYALDATEIYLDYIKRIRSHLYDHGDDLPQLMNRLFAEAEEREESDHGDMLRRVVSLQDKMLLLGVVGIDNWLKAAERP